MALDFPGSPSNGQTHTANGLTYTWDGTAWKKTSDFGVPSGLICMYTGSTAPSGWVICDNSSAAQAAGAPDLRDKFIVGAHPSGGDTTYPGLSKDASGGSADAVVVTHRHLPQTLNSMTSTEAGGNTLAVNNTLVGNYGAGSGTGLGPLGNRHFMQNEGVAGTNKNLPPYYALCFIMKT
tara:strand:+ start:763 stop:1299 length:537 start_codon:yes stop_codon:yes gene_type:complete